MSSVEDFLHDQQFEGLDELDADAEEALLADNDEGSEKNAYEEVEYVDDDGNPVEIGENEEVEVFELTEGHDGYQHEEGEQGFDDVLDLQVDDDLEFQTAQDAGTPGTSIPTSRQDVRRVTATTYGGTTNVKTPNEGGIAQDEKAELDFTLKEEEENESRLLSDSEEEEEDDDGARGRFKSERANMVSLTRVKQRVDIPDSLDAIVVNTDVSKGPGRLAEQRKPNSYGQNRSRDRNSAQWTHGTQGPQGPNAGNALLPAPIPLLSLPFQQPQKRGASHQSGAVKELGGHQQHFRIQQENKEQWINQQGDGGHGSRKILINPHFKGGSPTHKGTNSPHRVLQTDKQPKYDGNRTAHNEYVQQPVLPVPTQQQHQQQPGPQLGHHLRYSAPFGQPPPQVRPPENQNSAQIHQTYVQHRFPPPDPQVQMQHPNPAAGHPLLLHPSANQPPPNYQCSQFSMPLLPPPQMRTVANPSGGFNPSANNYATQGSVLGNYPGTNTVVQLYPRRIPNEPQHHPQPPQFNQYPPWNHEMNEPWRFPAQGPNPMAPPVQQPLPHPPHPPPLPTRWRHPQMQGPSLIPPQQQQQHQMQMHSSIAPRPQQQHPNFSAPPPLPQAPGVQRQVYRAQGPPPPPHGANLMGQFRATQSIQNVRPQTFRRQEMLPINPQGTGPVLRLISPVPMHELRRKQQQQLGQQQQQQMLRKRPAADGTGLPPKTARGPGGLPLKVTKVTNPLLDKPQGIKARVGVPRPGTAITSLTVVPEQEPAPASTGAVGKNGEEEEEEEDEEMKAYRAKIEMQKRKREEILRIKELRRQKMAEMRRKELLQTNKPDALPVIEVPPQPVAARLRPESVDPMVPSPVAVAATASGKKRVYLVRKLSSSGVAPVAADGPLQNVANRSLIGSGAVNLGNKDAVLLRKQQVQSRITLRPNPNLNRTPATFPGQTTRIVTFQNNVDVNFANALPTASHPTADTTPKRNFQMQPPQQVIAAIAKKTTVLVENLAQATTDAHLKKLCSTIGPVESVLLDKVQRVAQIVFPNVSDAETFISKYQRRMVDLSVINISMV